MLDNFFDLNNTPNTFTISSDNPLGTAIRGLGGNDLIIGSGNADIMLGNTGADTIFGLDEADTLYGGRGADLLFGNKGADLLQGERGNDVIYGGRGNDNLLGGVGDDFLAGDAGTDTLTGGEGSDAFVLDIRHSTTDRALADIITDFSKDGEDVFALTDGVNDTLTEADLNLETVGTDTFISLKATGAFLARVQGVSAAQITGTFSTVRATLDDTEPGATTLSLIPGKATVQGKVSDTDYIDFFQFQVTETSIVDFSLTGLNADADLALYQDRDADGEVGEDEVISQSVRSGNADETIENVTLKTGNYFLSVEQFEGDTNYNLNVAGVAGTVARDLAGSQPNTARTLSPALDGEAELHDSVGGTDAVDTYRLEVINSGYLDVFTEHRDAAVNLTLWSDRNGNNQLDADEIVAHETNEILLDSIDPGIYYVNVTAPGAPTPYEIHAINSPGSRVDIENYNPLYPGLPTTGTLSQNDDSDPSDPDNYADPYLLPELAAGLTVTVTQESKDFDAYLRVVDLITGEVVAENDDIDTAGGNFDARVSFTTAQGGQYVVYASSVDAPGLGDYTLNTTVTGTVTQTSGSSAGTGNDVQLGGTSSSSSGSIVANNSSSDSQQLPIPKPIVNVTQQDGSTKQQQLQLAYQPLAGGQINSNPINAMNQGGFGDCFFLAALTATFGKIDNLSVANSKQSTVLNNAITSNGNNYSIKLYNSQGKPLSFQQVPFTVDNQVLTYSNNGFTSDGEIYGARWQSGAKPTDASGQTPIWASLFEQAFAQRQGGFDGIGGGSAGNALAWITGKGIEFIELTPTENQGNQTVYPLADVKAIIDKNGFSYQITAKIQKDDIFTRIETALNEGRYVTAGIPGSNDKKPVYDGVLQEGHAYSVHNAYVDDNGRKMILVRNPWGQDNNSNAKAAEDPSNNLNDGFVAITFDAFLKNFGSVNLSKA